MNRRDFLATGAGALAAAYAAPSFANRNSKRPNIVFLLSDDQRADTLGCAGNKIILTPELDKLADAGTRFENAFVTTPICPASRASILTGTYSACHKLERFDAPLSPKQFRHSYPALLRSAGYHTGFVGKYGLGGDLPASEFDVFDGFAGQGVYFPKGEESGIHLESILGDQACGFIGNSPKDKPFCLSVSFKAPHVEDSDPRQFLYDPKLESLYSDVEIPTPPLAEEKYFNALPEFIRTSEARKRWFRRFATPEMYQQMVKGYYRLISGIDLQIGRIRSALEERGVADNTVIVYTSDHGFYLGERGLAGKWFMHEESIRVPFIIDDPRIPKRKQGVVRSQMALNIDVAPTLLEVAGITPPSFMQGRSLLPCLEEADAIGRKSFYLEHHFGSDNKGVSIPASEGVRTADWKYFQYVGRDPLVEEVYDLKNDSGETRNLIADAGHTDTVDNLRGAWRKWKNALSEWQADTEYVWHDPV